MEKSEFTKNSKLIKNQLLTDNFNSLNTIIYWILVIVAVIACTLKY